MEKGRTVGKVSIFQDDTLLNEYEVKAAADAPLLTFGGALEMLWQVPAGSIADKKKHITDLKAVSRNKAALAGLNKRCQDSQKNTIKLYEIRGFWP